MFAAPARSVIAAEASFDGLPSPTAMRRRSRWPRTPTRCASRWARWRRRPRSRRAPCRYIDETAFLMATLTNDTGELILPGETNLYLGETYVGQIHGDLIAAGGEAEALRPIEGLRLTRTVKEREEGWQRPHPQVERPGGDNHDRNREPDRRRMAAARAGPRALFRTGSPGNRLASRTAPDRDRCRRQRGVLAWDMTLDAGGAPHLTLEYEMQWPEGKVLH